MTYSELCSLKCVSQKWNTGILSLETSGLFFILRILFKVKFEHHMQYYTEVIGFLQADLYKPQLSVILQQTRLGI